MRATVAIHISFEIDENEIVGIEHDEDAVKDKICEQAQKIFIAEKPWEKIKNLCITDCDNEDYID